MRENIGLFKAKDINTNEWVEGFYFNFNARVFLEDKPTTRLKHCIVLNDTAELYIEIEIDPETLCECTGLKDKNGKMIFENDIVLFYNDKYQIVWGADGNAEGYTIQGFGCKHLTGYNGTVSLRTKQNEKLEIIGNVFEEVENEN